MSIALLPKYQIVPGEDPEVTAARLHAKKNRAVNAADDLEFPPYRFRPYPTCVYREWSEDARELEILRIAARHALDLEKRRDRITAESQVGLYESKLVGATDYHEHWDHDEVISELREKNDKALAAALEDGWAERPELVKDATRRKQIKLATAAAERQYEDRRLSPEAAAELERVDDAADDHVVDVLATRKTLTEQGKLNKEKR